MRLDLERRGEGSVPGVRGVEEEGKDGGGGFVELLDCDA